MRAFMLWALLASPSSLSAQQLVSTAKVGVRQAARAHSNAKEGPGVGSGKTSRSGFRVTLRPEPGLKALASKVARVLALRGDITVRHGPAPPPGLLEAVPAGDVALARAADASIQLVMGAPHGVSYAARVELSPNGQGDERALALALEALLDRTLQGERTQPLALPLAAEAAGTDTPADASPDTTELPDATGLTPADELASASSDAAPGEVWTDAGDSAPFSVAPAPAPAPEIETLPSTTAGMPAQSMPVPDRALPEQSPLGQSHPLRDDSEVLAVSPERPERMLHVDPMLFIAVYGGASSESEALRTGIGMGGGLCVQGQCLRLAVEYPLPISLEAGGGDVRYRYTTFSCSFYSRPFQWGRLTPAASIGLVSRIGHFERDMGITASSAGLDTDLGIRGTLESAYAILESVDVVAEAGVDYALDRWTTGHGETQLRRGVRTSPWLQAAIRIRPH